MASKQLAVRARDYAQHFHDARLLALPREELERLHGCIDVLQIDGGESGAYPAYLALHFFVAVHFNYAWLTCGEAPRVLGITSALTSEEEPPPFLDAACERLARAEVQKRLALPACEWRLSGLLHDQRLALIYVARLREPWRGASLRDAEPIQICGNGELQSSRAAFDPWSQALIDNLHAL